MTRMFGLAVLIGALGACSVPKTGPGVGFAAGAGGGSVENRENAGEALYQERVAALGGTPQTIARAPGAVPESLSRVRPKILAEIQQSTPLPVHQGNVAQVAASPITEASLRAMQAVAPELRTGSAPGRVQFKFGLVSGHMYRVRINGSDFALLETKQTMLPDLSKLDFQLMAYRAGCDWDGQSFEGKGRYAQHHSVIVTGLTCR